MEEVMPKQNDELSIGDAALELRIPYLKARDLMFRGVLKARKTTGGQYLVTRSSVEQAKDSDAVRKYAS